MRVRVEVWPLAADEIGLWLVSGDDALRSGNVPSDGGPHAEVERLLAQRCLQAELLHSTSWRVGGPAIYLTYIAVVATRGRASTAHPTALLVGTPRPGPIVGPLMHGPTDPPAPSRTAVLLHGLRHLRFLLDTDGTVAAVLDRHWRHHLAPLEPALAAMYRQRAGRQ